MKHTVESRNIIESSNNQLILVEAFPLPWFDCLFGYLKPPAVPQTDDFPDDPPPPASSVVASSSAFFLLLVLPVSPRDAKGCQGRLCT